MKQALYKIVLLIARIHNKIMSLNDAFEVNFSDKELHFIVVGLFGLALFLVLNPLFRTLVQKGKTNLITLIYTFTVLFVLTFAIEIGQYVTATGNMELLDIIYGLGGFLVIYAVYALLRNIFLWLWKKIVSIQL